MPIKSSLTWSSREESGVTVVQFAGALDESANFGPLREALRGPVEFHLEGIRVINSVGAREWLRFIRSIPRAKNITLTHCSTTFVMLLNQIRNFRGGAKVRSFWAPYRCDRCKHEVSKLIDVQEAFPDSSVTHPPTFTCEGCTRPLEFDELPDYFVGFVNAL